MNFTKSNSYATHTGTGQRQHQDSAVVPTVWSGDDANMVVWSLMQVLADAGVAGADFDADVPATYNRLSLALQALSGAAIPVGAVVASYFAPTTGTWVLLDGSLFYRADYPEVVSKAIAAGIVVSEAIWADKNHTKFGAGNGTTTMRWPDLRGESIRGLDNGRGVNAGRTLASWQDGMVQRHKHVSATGEHDQAPFGATTTQFSGIGASDTNNERPFTNDGSDYDGVTVNLPGVIGNETRVRGVALPWWMKVSTAALVVAGIPPEPDPGPPPPPPPPPAPPVADFSAVIPGGYGPQTVSFTDLSTNSPTSWLWDFGDGGTSTTRNPSHYYTVGTYTVTLTATNAGGSDAEVKVGFVVVEPHPGGF